MVIHDDGDEVTQPSEIHRRQADASTKAGVHPRMEVVRMNEDESNRCRMAAHLSLQT
jgi:hypothetical protein